MADNIKVDFSIETLEKEAKKTAGSIEPLKVALKKNVVITFSSPQELGVFDLLDFSEAGDDANITELLRKILSEDDYAALREYNPSGTVLGLLMQKVTAHYGVETDSKS